MIRTARRFGGGAEGGMMAVLASGKGQGAAQNRSASNRSSNTSTSVSLEGSSSSLHGEGFLPGCLEAERSWEQRHVLMALCKHAASFLASTGRGPAVSSLQATWGAVQASVQLEPPFWLRDACAIITPEQMVAAAEVLALTPEREPHWPLVWLGLELLCAPLPPGWTARAPKSSSALPVYCRTIDAEHAVGAHPLLPALLDEADIMRRRLRLRWRSYRPFESVWLFAASEEQWQNGAGPAIVYADLATGERSTKLPSSMLVRGSHATNATSSIPPLAGLAAVLKAKQDEARATADAERREKLTAAAIAAELQTRKMRRDALRTRPRCAVELMHAARALRIDLIAQPELAFLSELALTVGLPAGWVIVPPAAPGGAPRYKMVVSGLVSTTHPLEAYASLFKW